MRKWRFGRVRSIQYHTGVSGRAEIWGHLGWMLKSGILITSGSSQKWKLQLLCRWIRPWPSGLGGNRYRVPGPSQPLACGLTRRRDGAGFSQPLSLFRSWQHHLLKCTWPSCRKGSSLSAVMLLQLEKLAVRALATTFLKNHVREYKDTWIPSKTTVLSGVRIALGQQKAFLWIRDTVLYPKLILLWCS